MIYKEITLSAAMQMVVEGKCSDLFYEGGSGLVASKEIRFYLTQLQGYRWFRRIPEEAEL